jgi:hypothetical protein
MEDAMPHHHPHHGHHHPHPHALHGLNSVFLEALGEYELASTDDLRNLVDRCQPSLTPVLNDILQDGLDDPYVAIDLLQLGEAINTLRSMKDLILLSSSKKAAAILPLPPHIWHRLMRSFHSDMVFNSDAHLPPHLAGEHYQQIESLMPFELSARISGIEAIAMEGYLEDGRLLVRRSAARLLQMTGDDRRVRLYVHAIPHRPHHAEFCPLDVNTNYLLI